MEDIDNYITREGLALIEDKLITLEEKRPDLMEIVQRSREIGGDDNTDLSASLKEVEILDENIASIKIIMINAYIQKSIEPDVVGFGDVVTIENEDGENSTYKLVGTNEVNYWSDAVSIRSPIGQAIIGKEVGDEIDVVLPTSTAIYTIVEIDQKMYSKE